MMHHPLFLMGFRRLNCACGVTAVFAVGNLTTDDKNQTFLDRINDKIVCRVAVGFLVRYVAHGSLSQREFIFFL